LRRIVFLFACFLPLFVVSQKQDYTQYYKWVNQAKYYSLNKEIQKADSVYSLTFQLYNGFSDDYSHAMFVRNSLTGKIDTSYFISMVRNGELWRNAKYDLKRMGVEIAKPFKKLYRKNKYKKTISGFPIIRLMVRDQLYRSKNFRFLVRGDADSINALKIEKLLIKKPELFDRTKAGPIATAFLEPLLTHQSNWRYTQRIFFQIREKAKEGKLDPLPLIEMIHRASVFDGTFFHLENDSLVYELNRNKAICIQPSIYYSIVQGKIMRYYSNDKVMLMPLHPDYTSEQINRLRAYLFQPDLQMSFPKAHYTTMTTEEFCLKLGK
jgi:hypothetical protein